MVWLIAEMGVASSLVFCLLRVCLADLWCDLAVIWLSFLDSGYSV